MRDSLWTKELVVRIIFLFVGISIILRIIGNNVEIGNIKVIKKIIKEQVEQSEIEKWIIISPPIPKNTSGSIVDADELSLDNSRNTVLLNNVPTSENGGSISGLI